MAVGVIPYRKRETQGCDIPLAVEGETLPIARQKRKEERKDQQMSYTVNEK